MNFNPADYFVNTLAIVPGEEEESKNRVKVRTLLRRGCSRYYNFNEFPQCYLMRLTTELIKLLAVTDPGEGPLPPYSPYF